MASQLAAAHAKRQAAAAIPGGDLSVPLLGGEGREEKERKCCSASCCTSYFIAFVLSCGWFYELLAYGGGLYMVGTVLGTFFNFYRAYISSTLSLLPSVNQSTNEMRNDINAIANNTDKFEKQNEEGEKAADRIEQLNRELKMLAKSQGKSVDDMKQLIERNSKTLVEMKEMQAKEMGQKLVDLVIESDKDGDFVIDESEMDHLYLMLNNFRPNIKVNEENFKKCIKAANGELPGVLNMVKEITEGADKLGIPVNERVFKITETKHNTRG